MKLKEVYGCFIPFYQVQHSATSCRICCLYKDIVLAVVEGRLPSLFEGHRDETDKQSILDSLVLRRGWQSRDELTFNIRENEKTVALFRDADADRRRDFTIQGRNISKGFRIGRRTNSNKTFEKARQWLLECLTSHDCLRPTTSSVEIQLPKRLLDVRGSTQDPIRLIETHGGEYPYACLSHRWGSPGHKQLKTTTRTLQKHMANIPWDDLPATFQDAVIVCRRMEVSYVWIDSLCILQDFGGITMEETEITRQDFAHENSTMARTYQNSYFTISADLSTHMDSGIFSTLPIDDHSIEIVDDDGNNVALYFRQCVNHYGEDTPDLETRGWTLQEYILPQRVLHFGCFDVEWRCKNRHTCECGDLDLDLHGQTDWHRHHFFLADATRPVPQDLEGALRWWESVVHSFTARNLSNPNDKLPSLSGLAQLRKQSRDGVYLAGIWQESLMHDLCWFHTLNYNVATSGGVGRRPAEYRAPSWSWASVDTDSGCSFWWTGSIGMHPVVPWGEPRQICAIFGSFCQPKTDDPTGEVRYGFLDVGVMLIPSEICYDPQQRVVWTITNIETDWALGFFKPDCKLEDDGLLVGGRVYCAPITETDVETGRQRGCLVLKKLNANLYQRVGFCILETGKEPQFMGLSLLGIGTDDSVEPSSPSPKPQDGTFAEDATMRIMIF